MPKIAIIGPASVVFTRRLLGDMLSFPSLADSKIALMDIDAERLELISGLANRLVTDSKIGAQREATTVPNVGLCHSVQNTARQLSEYIGADQSEMSYWTAGINHMAWFLKLERNGVDAYLNLPEAMDGPQISSMDTVPFEVLRQAEYFVSESTRHMSEYVPYFRGDPIRMERFSLAPFDLGARAQQLRVDAHYETIREELESDAPMVAQRTNKYAAYIMDSTETGTLR